MVAACALFWMKHLPQVSQLNGRSPVCIRWWPFRVSAWLKLFPQVSHLNGFSPLLLQYWHVWSDCSHQPHFQQQQDHYQARNTNECVNMIPM
uniref:Uncharacterized protein n=1 Tax=Lates calcarifer TaxID=8187 RepID=A0A4W6D2B5_LATCA